MSIDAQLAIISDFCYFNNVKLVGRPAQAFKMFNNKSALLLIALFGAFAVVCSQDNTKYSNKYDYVNVDAILANPRQRTQYYKCFADEGPCVTPDSKFFRDNLREAIATNCKKCTDAQRIHFDKISQFYSEKEPEKYRNIVSKLINVARSN